MKEKCRCRPAKIHRDCAYCGTSYSDGRICGVCAVNGIDGLVIRGTSRVICKLHKRVRPINKYRLNQVHKIMSSGGVRI